MLISTTLSTPQPPKPRRLKRAGLPIDHSHTTLKYQALHAAVEFGHLDAARLLVCMGAKVGRYEGACFLSGKNELPAN